MVCKTVADILHPHVTFALEAIEEFAATQGIDLGRFEKGQRKDDLAHQYLARFPGDEGVRVIGKAQEQASVFRTEKRRDDAGKT